MQDHGEFLVRCILFGDETRPEENVPIAYSTTATSAVGSSEVWYPVARLDSPDAGQFLGFVECSFCSLDSVGVYFKCRAGRVEVPYASGVNFIRAGAFAYIRAGEMALYSEPETATYRVKIVEYCPCGCGCPVIDTRRVERFQ